MIASREEFLLLLRKWKTSSASVTVWFAHGGSTSDDPHASLFMLSLFGHIAGIDEASSFFVVEAGEDGALSVGFDGALFEFGTAKDLDPSFTEDLAEHDVDEMVTLALASGLRVSFVTFK